MSDAWLGSEVGWVKVHCAIPRVWSEWLVCAAVWLTPDANDITAGDAAATNAIANRANIFGFILFPIDPIGFYGI